MPRPLELPTIPESIGPYQILGIIGQGGMGVVYLGAHRATSARAAIKTVRLPREALLSALRREIHALQSLRHPGVVRILEQGVEAGMPWYAMELLEGRTLADGIRAAWEKDTRKAAEIETIPVGISETVPVPARRGGALLTPRPSSGGHRPPAAGGALPLALSVVRELRQPRGRGLLPRSDRPRRGGAARLRRPESQARAVLHRRHRTRAAPLGARSARAHPLGAAARGRLSRPRRSAGDEPARGARPGLVGHSSTRG